MDIGSIKASNRLRAVGITIVAHLFGILAIILLLVWLLHYRGGVEYDSEDAARVLNVHPLMMFVGFIFLAGEAMMAYHTVPAERRTQKTFHMIFHLIAIIFGIVGLCAVFKFHEMYQVEDVYSLHSWIGIGTFCLFCLQWLFGFLTFFASSSSDSTRIRMAPWHISGGRALLYMAICTALTGLMERFRFLSLRPDHSEPRLFNFTGPLIFSELRLINFMGISILLFGVFVDISVALAHYV
ncbi:hypothetical protein L6164_001399 [Bauhinia variegata]|uniref:Uncharacterized protein n=1 Tax=Bauhinia variegata TaxID=167791 RepID=A0ACB9QC91_BAUVA|nr:hypothetical protein L6164_001399 [Bauhinia variegata]